MLSGFCNRHIRVYYAACAPRLNLKTRRFGGFKHNRLRLNPFFVFSTHNHKIQSEFELCPRINNYRPEPHIIPSLRHTFFILSVSPAGDLHTISKLTFEISLLKRILPHVSPPPIREMSAVSALHLKNFSICSSTVH